MIRHNKRPIGLLTKFPKVPIEERKPFYDNSVTRRTEQAHSSGKYLRKKLDKKDTERSLRRRDKAFRETIDLVLGYGWYEVNKIGRIKHERR